MRRGEEAFLGEDMQIMVNGLTMTYVDNFALRAEFTMNDVALPGQTFVQTRKGQGRITGTMSGFTFSSYLFKIAMNQTQTLSSQRPTSPTGKSGHRSSSNFRSWLITSEKSNHSKARGNPRLFTY